MKGLFSGYGPYGLKRTFNSRVFLGFWPDQNKSARGVNPPVYPKKASVPAAISVVPL